MKLLAIALLLAQTVFVNYAPHSAYRIATPAQYYEWNDELEQCTGIDVNVDDVEFYAVDEEFWFSARNGFVVGEYFPAELGNKARIYVGYVNMYEPWLIKHELTHHHLAIPGHPEPPFGDCEYR